MSDEFAKVEAELSRRGYTRMVFDLARIEALLDLLGSPQRAYQAIHLTGTNGKTSTARMIDSVLRAHGLRTGRYTSPHLETVRERISIDGEPVDEERFVEIYREVAPVAQFLDERDGEETLTYFDMTTSMALAAFADAPVDVAVVEVGLGGADDSTNVLQAGTVVMTPIGLDHTEWLGDTLEDIATAKSGIIHKGATVDHAPPSHPRPWRRSCGAAPRWARPSPARARSSACCDASWPSAGRCCRCRAWAACTTTSSCRSTAPTRPRTPPSRWPRWRRSSAPGPAPASSTPRSSGKASPAPRRRAGSSGSGPRPTMLLDAAHNPHGMAVTVAALQEEFAFSRLVGVVAVLADKDVVGMLELLEPVARRRRLHPQQLAAAPCRPTSSATIAVEIFGEDRVRVEPLMPDAIEAAVAHGRVRCGG